MKNLSLVISLFSMKFSQYFKSNSNLLDSSIGGLSKTDENEESSEKSDVIHLDCKKVK